jgi:hypothetical protein
MPASRGTTAGSLASREQMIEPIDAQASTTGALPASIKALTSSAPLSSKLVIVGAR